MATTSQLENQIRELRSQLAESDRKLRNLRAEIDENNTRQYEELRCKYNKLLEKKTKENSIKYEQELQCLRMEMFELNKQREKAVHQAIQTARRDQSIYLKKLEEKNLELKKIVKELQENEQRQNQVSSSYSKRMINEANYAMENAAELPHDFFFPQQFSIIQEHLTRAYELAEKKMYEASAATADAARVEIELLLVKTIQKIGEWKELFELYCEVVRRLYERMDSLINIRLQTEAGLFPMNTRELDFWSQGLFSLLYIKIKDAYETVKSIEAEGINEYLKHQSPMTLLKLNRNLNEVEEMEIRLEAVDQCIRSERSFSDARFITGHRIIDLLGKYGYTNPEKAGFLRINGKEDPRDCYEILYRVRKLDELRITIIPVRKDGVCVRNRVLVKWSVKSTPDSGLVIGVSETIKKRIAALLEEDQVQIVSQEKNERVNVIVEDLRKSPDPNLLFERLRH